MAHAEISTTAGDIVLQSEFREKELVKQIPGSRFDSTEKQWHVPLSWGSCITLRGVFGDTLVVGPELSEWSWNEFNNRVSPAANIRTALESPELMNDEPKLYPYQRAGVTFLEAAQSALIADEMGSGKTIQIIRTVDRNAQYPALVIAPNSMKYTWKEEWLAWTDLEDQDVVVISGSAAQRRKQLAKGALVFIMNWESLRLHTRLESFGNKSLTEKDKEPKELNEMKFVSVIADEAHKAKDPNAKQTRALWAVGRQATHRYAATGTPVANQPAELWSIMNFVAPEDFPRKSKFVDRYCLVNWNNFGGMEIMGLKPETSQEFYQIADSRMIRRLKDVVLPYLPPKRYQTRRVEMGAKQAKAYKQMTEHMMAQVDEGYAVATNPLTVLTRLQQFASAYAMMDTDGQIILKDPSNKLDAMMEIIEESEGDQVVVFAESRQLIELASNRLDKANISYGMITGAASVEARQQDMETFQAGNLRVMLVTLGAGGEGITLTAARVAIFLQRSYSAVKNKQAEDRIHRPGAEQHDTVEIIDIKSAGTYEEMELVDALREKERKLQEVVRDDEIRAMLTFRGE